MSWFDLLWRGWSLLFIFVGAFLALTWLASRLGKPAAPRNRLWGATVFVLIAATSAWTAYALTFQVMGPDQETCHDKQGQHPC